MQDLREFSRGARARLLCSAAVVATLAPVAFATSAFAQDASLEEIVVTGSRIARPELVSSSPVTVVGAETFEQQGAATLDSVLNELPQIVPALGSQSNNGGNGTATVDLRGVGASRTLVLVNGRRFIPTNGTGTVDLNNIPASLVERVDVVTGGASAVYGSDALAGVVNFVLKEDFRGAQASAKYGISDRGDAGEINGNLTIGTGSEDGRTNAVLFAEFNTREAVFAADREFSRQSITQQAGADGRPELVFSGSSTAPSGRIARGTEVFTWDANGNPRPFNSTRTGTSAGDLYNFSPINYLRVPQDRYSAFAMANHEIADFAKVYAELSFTENRVPLQLAETPAVLPQPRPGVPPIRINLTNPLLTPDTVALLRRLYPDATNPDYASVTTANALSRRMTELGPRAQDNNQNAFNSVLGMKGDLPFNLAYDTYIEFGRSQLNQLIRGDVSSTRLRNALDVTRDPVTGQAVCVSRAAGCVPLDIFGPGRISPAAAAYIQTNTNRVLEFNQTIWNGSVSGNLFDLPAGGLGVAVGSEYRKNEFSNRVDDAIRTGDILGFNPALSTQGSFDVWEGFAEVLVPLVSDLPFAKYVGLEGAVRYSDYSSVGGVTAYMGGAEWAITGDIRLRGQYQRAIRAPNVLELFQGGQVGFPTLNNAVDPCMNVNVTAQQRALCIAQGVPAAQVGTAAFNANRPTQYQSLTVGSAVAGFDLREEKSDTWTIGGVFTPEFLPDFSATLDWWQIDISRYIGGFGGGGSGVVANCFANNNINSETCQALSRTADGYLAVVRVPTVNNGSLKTSGIDVGVNYRHDLPEMVSLFEDGSTISFAGNLSYRDKYDYQPLAGGTVFKCAGYSALNQCPTTSGDPAMKWKGSLTTSYTSGPFSASLQWNYIGSWKDEAILLGANPANLLYPETPSLNYFDISAGYQVTEAISLRAGILNMFDRDPPQLTDTVMGSQQNTFSNTYDVLGRRYFVTTTVKF
ncbi:MAG TPA: TonB-dependent receptor [Azospirillaceae bacterium]|nr:TonB-dependent receptor [Azospirillaceae bacterium]